MDKNTKPTSATVAHAVTIGINRGDRQYAICVLDSDGEILREDSIANTLDALSQLAEGYPQATGIIETGTHSPWISWHLEACGLKVLVANACKLRS